MLATSFVKNADGKNNGKFWKAVAYYAHKYEVANIELAISKADKVIKSEDSNPEQIAGAEKMKKKLESERKKEEKLAAGFLADYELVVKDMVAAGNSQRAVENCIKLIATDAERLNFPHAWTLSEDDAKKLKSALDTIHVTGAYSPSGMVSNTKAVKEAVKTAKGDIERVIKDEFSLPVETVYTKKFMCNCNAGDLRMIHETYVTGLRTVKTEYKGEKILTGLTDDKSSWFTATVEMKTAISERKRKGQTSIFSKPFCNTLAQIIVAKYSK